METKFASVKKFVSDHKVAIAVTVTSAAWLALTVRNSSNLNEFLKEKNLMDEYYKPVIEV